MRISDWSSDVCSSDLFRFRGWQGADFRSKGDRGNRRGGYRGRLSPPEAWDMSRSSISPSSTRSLARKSWRSRCVFAPAISFIPTCRWWKQARLPRSEEHTSELQSLMRISYAVFCLKKKNMNNYKY